MCYDVKLTRQYFTYMKHFMKGTHQMKVGNFENS
jgi:hypothetical protein